MPKEEVEATDDDDEDSDTKINLAKGGEFASGAAASKRRSPISGFVNLGLLLLLLLLIIKSGGRLKKLTHVALEFGKVFAPVVSTL